MNEAASAFLSLRLFLRGSYLTSCRFPVKSPQARCLCQCQGDTALAFPELPRSISISMVMMMMMMADDDDGRCSCSLVVGSPLPPTSSSYFQI